MLLCLYYPLGVHFYIGFVIASQKLSVYLIHIIKDIYLCLLYYSQNIDIPLNTFLNVIKSYVILISRQEFSDQILIYLIIIRYLDIKYLGHAICRLLIILIKA